MEEEGDLRERENERGIRKMRQLNLQCSSLSLPTFHHFHSLFLSLPLSLSLSLTYTPAPSLQLHIPPLSLLLLLYLLPSLPSPPSLSLLCVSILAPSFLPVYSYSSSISVYTLSPPLIFLSHSPSLYPSLSRLEWQVYKCSDSAEGVTVTAVGMVIGAVPMLWENTASFMEPGVLRVGAGK